MAVPLTAGDEEARERLEIDLLLEAIQRRYSYDFRGYARASLRRRLWHRAHAEGLATLSGCRSASCTSRPAWIGCCATCRSTSPRCFATRAFTARCASACSRCCARIRSSAFWNAGCSTGEEIYSLAIALREEGLLERMKLYTENYLRAGGREAFSSSYVADSDQARFDSTLAEGVVFAQHNLVTDGSFNEFHLIVCRNVMIYFGFDLQEAVLQLFGDSMARFGILALGRKESIRRSRQAELYEPLDEAERIFRRRR